MTTLESSIDIEQTVELAPSYRIPLVLVLFSIPLLLIWPWLTVIFALFGLFLMIQTATIRLRFTPTALDVYRSGNLIRRFPYDQWYSWSIFWRPFPVLFYFKEVKSIHFLPMLFDVNTLTSCLEKYCPNKQ